MPRHRFTWLSPRADSHPNPPHTADSPQIHAGPIQNMRDWVQSICIDRDNGLMTTYACPRCKKPSIPQGCPYCGRDEEPLLQALADVDEAIAAQKPDTDLAELKARHTQILKDLQAVAKKYQDPNVTTHPGPDMVPPQPPKPEPIAKNPLKDPDKTTPLARQNLPAYNQAAQEPPPAPTIPANTSTAPADTPPAADQTPPMPPHPYPQDPQQRSADSSGRAIQTILLSLGGLLTAAALAGFTIYAWDLVGDIGRFAILAIITAALFAAPAIFSKYRLYATAETFAALASVGLWCTTLAAYYQTGQHIDSEVLTVITLAVIAAIGIYRALTRYTASSWALLGLSALAAIFASTLDIGGTVALLVTAALSGLSALLVRNRPSTFPASDRFAYRALGVGAIALGFITIGHAAYATNLAKFEMLTALVILATASALWGVAQQPRFESLTTQLTVITSIAGAILLGFILAIESAEAVNFISLIAIFTTFLVWITAQPGSPSGHLIATTFSTVSFVVALGGFGYLVVGDHPLLVFAVATGVAALISLLVPGDTKRATQFGISLAGLTVAGLAAFIALSNALSYLNNVGEPLTATGEVLLATVASAIALMLAKSQGRWRFDSVAAALLIVSISVITHLEGPWWVFTLAAALTAAAWAAGAHQAPTSVVYIRLPLAITVAVFSFIPLGTSQANAPLGTLDAGDSTLLVAIGLYVFYALVSYTLAFSSPQLPVRITTWIIAPVLLAGALVTMVSLGWFAGEIAAYLVTGVALLQVLVVSSVESKDPYASRWAFVTSHILAGLAILWFYAEPVAEGTASVAMMVYAVALGYLAWYFKTQTERMWYASVATLLALFAYWNLMADLDLRVLELYTVAPAVTLLALGAAAKSVYPQVSSWLAFTPGLALGMAPSLVLVMSVGADAAGEAPRRIILGAVAIAVLLWGTTLRYQAPLILGAGVVAVLTVRELVLLTTMAPSWLALAIGGVILLAAGATFERQRQYLARFGTYVKDLT